MAETHTFTTGEEVANAITHGIGVLLSIAGLVLLIVFSVMNGTALHVVSFTIFGSSMVILYTSSTLVHALPKGKAKDLFEIFDHSSIYLFIAGTYTPFTLLVIKGTLGWTMFGIVWGLAIAGIIFKAFFVKKFLVTSTILYLLMGWMVVIGWNRILDNVPYGGVALLVAGGLCYTVGTIFYMWRGFKFHHLVWHIFVLAGTICHFFSVLLYLV
ncbi:PAQR family membrane homeostasis protein TrhA [Ornithinibacillus bavariensis]|uniref:Hemolysin III family protein n=1 Tax=Ornithinibacillus bavariensis TaxID=545502 RepID=A0A920C4L0_9BACI|nr:hemolysin III family protein [Ornithinibacillus bavariensis]GIO25826.1 hemolysin III family protein [Ornithinibacillus bavariensis]HAM79764.1 hemolysin D [Ornithinibacillus sp.]